MFRSLQQILLGAIERVGDQVFTFGPPVLAALIILLVTIVIARVVRWGLMRSFRGAAIDRFLSESGIRSMLGLGGRTTASRLVTGAVCWTIVLLGCLTALNALGMKVMNDMVAASLSLLPRLMAAATVILAGIWIAQYLGRTVLVWTYNEGLPSPRRWSAGLRTLIILMSVVVASDMLNFAEFVFLAVFLVLCGGAVLALSLAIGLGGRIAVENYLSRRGERSNEEDSVSMWQHL
jgi:hypothetical protein